MEGTNVKDPRTDRKDDEYGKMMEALGEGVEEWYTDGGGEGTKYGRKGRVGMRAVHRIRVDKWQGVATRVQGQQISRAEWGAVLMALREGGKKMVIGVDRMEVVQGVKGKEWGGDEDVKQEVIREIERREQEGGWVKLY